MKNSQIIQDIKDLNIQGAQNIALASLDYIFNFLGKNKFESSDELVKKLDSVIGHLMKTRPTEPCMKNTIRYVHDVSYERDILKFKNKILERIQEARNFFSESQKKIDEITKRKIKNGTHIYTHCHSSTVISALIYSKKTGINFVVYNTETRPRFQGRRTAEELAKQGIKVHHFIDSALKHTIKAADIVLIGCDAILSTGEVVNKIGTNLITEIADKYDVPVYICTDSWKFDPFTIKGYEEPIENRPSKEVWDKKINNIKIHNPAFDIIEPDHITGIISELGIYPPLVFVEEVKREYPWMFN